MANLILSISPPFPKPPTWSFLKQNQNTITFLGILEMEALLSSTGRDCKPGVAGNRCHHVELPVTSYLRQKIYITMTYQALHDLAPGCLTSPNILTPIQLQLHWSPCCSLNILRILTPQGQLMFLLPAQSFLG